MHNGKIVEKGNGSLYKRYRGSASLETKSTQFLKPSAGDSTLEIAFESNFIWKSKFPNQPKKTFLAKFVPQKPI